MNETQYINDDFGNKIPLLDNSGNLSLQVIMLYTEDKLTSADRKIVDDFASQDEFTRDALDGFALTSNASKTRFAVGELNSSIQKRTGAKAVSTLIPQDKSQFDFRKMAAAITILVILGGTTFFATQFFKDDSLALEDKVTEQPKEVNKQNKEFKDAESEAIQLDTIADQTLSQDKLQIAEENLFKSPQEPEESTESSNQTKVSEKSVVDLKEPKELQRSNDAEEEFSADLALEDADASILEETTSRMLGSSDDIALDEVVGIEEPSAPVLDQQKDAGMIEEIAQESKQKESESRAAALSTIQLEERMRAEDSESYREELANSRKAEESSMAQAVSKEAERLALEQAQKLADQSARFPGGDIKMYRFIERKKNYTQAMRNQGLSGNVTISFDIETDGRVTNAKVKTGVSGLLDQDALRIVRSMPKWEPAIRGGSNIRSSRSVVVKYGD